MGGYNRITGLRKTLNRYIRVFIILCVTLQIAWYSQLMVNLLKSPDLIKRTDFVIFYLPGRIANEISPALIYDGDLQYEKRQELLGFEYERRFFLPFNHPPIMLPLMRLIAVSNIVTSFLMWTGISLLIVIISSVLLNDFLSDFAIEIKYRLLALMGMILFYPLFISILKGQDTTLLMLAVVVWFLGLEKQDDRLAGLGLALAVIRPHIAIVLAIPFLFRRRPVFYWFMTGSSILAFYCVALIGISGARTYIQVILDTAKNSDGAGQAAMFNFLGVILRIFPSMNVGLSRLFAWGIFLAAILLLCIIWFKSSSVGVEHASLAVVIALLTVPHLHYHDLTLLFIPLMVMSLVLVKERGVPPFFIGLLLVGISTLLLLSDIINPIRFVSSYVISVFLILFFVQRIGLKKINLIGDP